MFRHFMIQINELKITPLHNLRVAENQNLYGATQTLMILKSDVP